MKFINKLGSLAAVAIMIAAVPLAAHPGHQSHNTETDAINPTQTAAPGTSWCRDGDAGYCYDWAVNDHANGVADLYQANGATLTLRGNVITATGFNAPVTYVSFLEGRVGGKKRSNLVGGTGQAFAPRGTLIVGGKWLYIDCDSRTVPGVTLVGLVPDCSQPDHHGRPVGALMAADFRNPS